MPTDVYGTLYPVQELDVSTARAKDIYAKKPEPTAAKVTTPFIILQTLNIKILMIAILKLPLVKPIFLTVYGANLAKLYPTWQMVEKIIYPINHNLNLVLPVPDEDIARKDFTDLPARDMTTSSHKMLEVASEAPLVEEVSISEVALENHADFDKAQWNNTLSPPPDQSIMTRTDALLGNNLAIPLLNVLNVIVT